MTHAAMEMLSRFMLLTVFTFASAGTHAQDQNADIYGQWKIKDMIGMGAVASLSEHQARKLIGKTLFISAERYEFNGQVCSNPLYNRSRENPVTYFDREWHTGIEGIPFPNPVTIIEVTGCDYLYPIRRDHLMIAEDGVFFEAVRIKSWSKKPASHSRP
ncbi:MAG: hypothetical protein QFF03_13880 [Pseudomonadota bacterium]|nr:hypothetical protein [Pseudomonadota bacterium]